MTVKIERPSFNLREKLSELDRPVGNLGTEILKTNTIDEFFHNYAIGRKNLLINGQFDVWQRGTSFANQGSGNTGYKADRWRIYSASGSVVTITRESFNAGQNKVPGNPRYMLRLSNVPDANTTWMEIEQRVEDVTRFSDCWITISFWIRTNQPQYENDRLRVAQVFGSGGSSSVVIGDTKFNISTDWERKVFTYYCPTISGKTVGASSFFEMKTLQTSATQADTYYDVANFQMEYGRQATPFEQRSLGEELQLCRRYYQVLVDQAGTSSQKSFGIACAFSGSSMHSVHPLIPPMRTTPTIDYTTGSNYYKAYFNNTSDSYDSIALVANSHPHGADLMVSSGLSVTQGNAVLLRTQNGASKIAFQAEM